MDGYGWPRATPIDDVNLVSCAGLVPVMALAEQAGLSELIAERVSLASARVASAGKLTSIIAGMAAGADCIDDLGVIRSRGMPRLFTGVYAPATLGQFLREFTHGHTSQLAAVARTHLVIGNGNTAAMSIKAAKTHFSALLRTERFSVQPVAVTVKPGALYARILW